MRVIQQFFRMLFAAIDVGERAEAVQYQGPEALRALGEDFRQKVGIGPQDSEQKGKIANRPDSGEQPLRFHAELRHRHHPAVFGDC